MSMNRLLSDVSSRGIARNNRYDVVIAPPGGFGDATQLSISCEIASLPGKGYATTDRRTYGPLVKVPYEKLYNEIQMTFRCDADMSEKKFFDSWYDLVAVPGSHHFNYYDDYVGTIIIIQQDGRNRSKYTATLLEAYPTIIGDLELTQEGTNEYHKLPVTFAYKEWIT